ncbi:Deleted in malignant brain tumors 1 protein, partial [Aptenodytes forsteri]
VRLVDGPGRCAGRVEVFHNEKWGTVCDDSWDFVDAKVVCRQLDCGTVVTAPRRAHFGQGQGPIWLDDVRCMGTEAALSECRAKGWGVHGCEHGEDASVVCSGWTLLNIRVSPTETASVEFSRPSMGRLRLVGGLSECAGRVEVFYNNKWGTVCDDSWDLRDAAVVCRQLGCGVALSAPGSARFGWGAGPIWLDDVSCTGEETDFSKCQAKMWGIHNCHHGEDAGVVCAGESQDRAGQRQSSCWYRGAGSCPPLEEMLWMWGCPATTCLPISLSTKAGNSSSADLRLVDGPHRCAGRVEVLNAGQWGTVCDDGWDLNDAAVVCRQLGCGRAEAAPGRARFGQGMGRIWLDDVACAGSEDALAQCRAHPWGQSNCNHGEDASVVCSGTSWSCNMGCPGGQGGGSILHLTASGVMLQAEVAEVRLAEGPNRCGGRVEVLHAGQWGTVCDDSWDLNDAAVVCRQLGCGRAEAAPGRAYFGQGTGHIWLDDMSCTGSEDNLAQCQAHPWGQSNCHHGEDAGVVC